ncbi:hypothetical protein JCM11641_005463 [Rhodosporidiobolus odoratus]
MPPRRRTNPSTDPDSLPQPETRTSSRRSTTSTNTKQSLTRSTRAKVSHPSTVNDHPKDESGSDSDSEHEEQPQPSTTRSSRRSTTNSQRPPTSRASATSSSTSTSCSSTRPTRAQTSAASASRRSARVSAAATVSSAATEESDSEREDESEQEKEGEEEEEEQEEEPVKPRSRRAAPLSTRENKKVKMEQNVAKGRGAKRQVETPAPETDEDEQEEEEEDEPVRAPVKGKARRASHLPTPDPESGAETETGTEVADDDGENAQANGAKAAKEDDDEDDDEDDEEEAGTPRPVTPAKPKKGKARAVVQDSSDDDENEDEVDKPAAGSEDPLEVNLPPPTSGQAPPSPAPSAATPPRASPSSPAASAVKLPLSPAEPPLSPANPPPPPVPTALTASTLASLARQAALDHSAQSAQREKELEGKPRLVIDRLVLENFKSYKGRGVIGPFHKSFSSIVGPNGSGKSNTIDALLFVFGFRATKMRQGKFSELIHNSGPPASSSSSATAAMSNGEGQEEEENGSEESEEESEEVESQSEEERPRKKGGKGKDAKGKGKKATKSNSRKERARYDGGCDYATVEVWFREVIDLPGGRDNFSVVPNSQLIVARTVKKDNSTRYTFVSFIQFPLSPPLAFPLSSRLVSFRLKRNEPDLTYEFILFGRVNGKAATPTEVKQMLLGRGIDLTHNRFLILQGEVESIAQMPPKGRTSSEEGLLEYLEDIIGTADYKPLIEEAVVEVERLGDERGVVMNRVKLVEREKGALEVRKKSADAFLRDQLVLLSSQSTLYQRHAHQAQADKVLYEEQVEQAKGELEGEMERQRSDRERYEKGVGEVKEGERGLKETFFRVLEPGASEFGSTRKEAKRN